MRRTRALTVIRMAIAGGAACALAYAAPPARPGCLSGAAPADFAQALAPTTFAFPRDHGPHPQFRQEWWYVTGNLDAASGERLGFELTFFRFALQPEAAVAPAAPRSSAWRTRQIYLAHFAITDVAAGRFRFAQKLSREALGLAGAQAAPLRVWIDDWSLEAASAGAAAQERWSLRAAQPGYELELTLQGLTAPVLNGDAGLSRKSGEPGAATYYYSIPRLAVHGRLIRDGHPLEVHGLAWVDREWGSGGLGARQVGWDWFALQLNDGTALMFYALRDQDNRRDQHSAGTWVEASGRSRPLSSEEVTIEVADHWSNAQGTRYPSSWRIRVPALALQVSVRPVLADQELRTMAD
ncbi:MAG TPA: lipocalin-like domain-containing protein, partial [Steroidobacteraceae bacterium]